MEKRSRRPFHKESKETSGKEGSPFKKRTRATSEDGERPRFESRFKSRKSEGQEERSDRPRFQKRFDREEGEGSFDRKPRSSFRNDERNDNSRFRSNDRGSAPRFDRKPSFRREEKDEAPRFERRGRFERSRFQDHDDSSEQAPRARTPRGRFSSNEQEFQPRRRNFSSDFKSDRKPRPFGDRREKKDFTADRREWKAREPKEQDGDNDAESQAATTDFIFGRNPVMEALQSGREINAVMIADGTTGLNRLIALAKDKGIPIKNVNRQKLDQISNQGVHQGVAASIAAYTYADWETVLAAVYERGETPFIVVLDHIEDPHNLGSILRSSDATGVHLIVIPTRQAVGLTSTVAKSSAGAIEHVPVARVGNIAQALEKLKAAGLAIVGTDSNGAKSFKEATYDGPLALVIGSEGKGMRPIVANNCDQIVRIPLAGKVNSLNASVAAAICLFEIAIQRGVK